MKKYIKYLLGLVIIILIIIGMYVYSNKLKVYSKNFFYMDTYINVKLYTNNKTNADNMFKKVDEIYKKYQKLTDVYNTDSDIYYVNNNDSNLDILEIDKDLYSMIELALSWYEKSENKFNINLGSVIKIWKSYRDNEMGIPTLDELKNAYNSINSIVLLGNNKIKNNHPSIDLGGISKGYASQEVAEMLKNSGINNFIINAGGNVVVGKAYNKEKYSIGIENPEIDNDLYQVVKGNDISIVTSGGYERFYEYNGVKYHHIIDPDTLFPANNYLSVTVIANDSALADILSTTLFLLPIDKGLEIIDSMDDVEAIYYIDSNNIIKSKGFNKYE